MTRRINDKIQTQIAAAIDAVPVENPQSEIQVWQAICAAPNPKWTRFAARYAQEHEKLNQTIEAWSEEERWLGESPEDRALWWTHPITHQQMVVVPGGKCLLGARALPSQTAGFSFSRHPVTYFEFQNFLKATSYEPQDIEEHGEFVSNAGFDADRALHPVTWVNSQDAAAYCHWAAGRLPSVLEWEKAARGTDGRRFPWGNRSPYSPQLKAQVRKQTTAPVGSHHQTRSPYGIEEMAGNVSQWCLQDAIAVEKDQHPVKGACFHRKRINTLQATHVRYLNSLRRNAWVGIRLLIPAANSAK